MRRCNEKIDPAPIVAAYSAPDNPSMALVGKAFGITGERVRQVVVKWEEAAGEHVPRASARRKAARVAEALARRARRPSVAQRLLANAVLDPSTGCWVWTGKSVRIGDRDFPAFGFAGEQHAHRVAYRLWRGPIPRYGVVTSACERNCINPFHLNALSRADFMRSRDPVRRIPQTHCKRGHALVDENVDWNTSSEVRDGVRVSVRTRLCRICDRARHLRNRRLKATVSCEEGVY